MIPKVVYQTWKTKQLPKQYEIILDHNKSLNPEYQFILLDDDDLVKFFNTQDPLLKNAFFKINPKYGASRADLFRYVIIYLHGGIYLDVKIKCIQPFKEWIINTDQGILSYWENLYYQKEALQNLKGELQNWHIIFEKNHSFLKKVIEHVCQEILKVTDSTFLVGKQAVLQYTGPLIYTQTIENLLWENISNPVRFINSALVFDYGSSFFGLDPILHYSMCKEPLFLL